MCLMNDIKKGGGGVGCHLQGGTCIVGAGGPVCHLWGWMGTYIARTGGGYHFLDVVGAIIFRARMGCHCRAVYLLSEPTRYTRIFTILINDCIQALHKVTALRNYGLPLIFEACKSPHSGDLHVSIPVPNTHNVVPLLRYKCATLFHNRINL